jgi:PTH1 family peptidyl-tRNA hydrolase
VGLGNPGEAYADTRHNVGAWFTQRLAEQDNAPLQTEPKFHGRTCLIQSDTHKIRLLIPTTFMNNSGRAVRAMAQFYQIPLESILVAHDELDFPAGIVRLKKDGGHGGHNGLRDIVQHLGPNFYRLRIGIGHPGHSSQVSDYVLSRPSKEDYALITYAIEQAIRILPELVLGDAQKAMQQLHTDET